MDVISLVNMKGGVGKTTLAVNIAEFLAEREEKSVLLVDLDPQFNATQSLLSGEEYIELRTAGGHTILDIFNDFPAVTVNPVSGVTPAKPTTLDEMEPWILSPNLDLIPGDLELHRLEMGGGQGREQRLKRYLEQESTRDRYDFVIIDTPPTPSHWMTSALLASDFYLVPLKPEPLSRVGIDLLRNVIQRFSENHGHNIECLGVVLTMAETNTVVFKDTVKFLDQNQVWAEKRFDAVLPKRTKIARLQGHQQTILQSDDTELQTAMAKVVNELTKRLDG